MLNLMLRSAAVLALLWPLGSKALSWNPEERSRMESYLDPGHLQQARKAELKRFASSFFAFAMEKERREGERHQKNQMALLRKEGLDAFTAAGLAVDRPIGDSIDEQMSTPE